MIRGSVFLSLLLAAAVLVAVATANPRGAASNHSPAQAREARGGVGEVDARVAQLGARPFELTRRLGLRAPSPYWRVERKLVAALRREGRLGAEVRTLRRQQQTRTLEQHRSTQDTIRLVFGSYGEQAVRVAGCETGQTYSTTARNGQYLGLFQMGDYARSTYGHGWTALEQALAAYRYFVASGYDWSPWECKP